VAALQEDYWINVKVLFFIRIKFMHVNSARLCLDRAAFNAKRDIWAIFATNTWAAMTTGKQSVASVFTRQPIAWSSTD
jgi:hypothetical protein